MDGLTITLGITATLTTCAALWFAVLAKCHKFLAESRLRSAERWKAMALHLCQRLDDVRAENRAHVQRELRRVNQCHEAGRTSAERARERREARTSKTTAALCSAPLRPRDEVVAGVRK